MFVSRLPHHGDRPEISLTQSLITTFLRLTKGGNMNINLYLSRDRK
jgi:hypothetical protein